MEQILRSNSKFIIDQTGGAGGAGVLPYLPLQELQRRPAPATGSRP
jgi:hypothetical protein